MADVMRTHSLENIKTEVRLQRKLDHPHIARLYFYFNDKDNIYIALEYYPNGNLAKYLQKNGRLTEVEAFYYFVQTALAVEYLQANRIIHRDIKPENLLLDSKGNIKLSDFGWSALNMNRMRETYCGTVDYMAPEIANNLPYDNKVDIWSLGVLLYEITQGQPPFAGDSMPEKEANLKEGRVGPITGVSDACKDLILRILNIDPKQRPTIDDIFKHKFIEEQTKKTGGDITKLISRAREKSRVQNPEVAKLEKDLIAKSLAATQNISSNNQASQQKVQSDLYKTANSNLPALDDDSESQFSAPNDSHHNFMDGEADANLEEENSPSQKLLHGKTDIKSPAIDFKRGSALKSMEPPSLEPRKTAEKPKLAAPVLLNPQPNSFQPNMSFATDGGITASGDTAYAKKQPLADPDPPSPEKRKSVLDQKELDSYIDQLGGAGDDMDFLNKVSKTVTANKTSHKKKNEPSVSNHNANAIGDKPVLESLVFEKDPATERKFFANPALSKSNAKVMPEFQKVPIHEQSADNKVQKASKIQSDSQTSGGGDLMFSFASGTAPPNEIPPQKSVQQKPSPAPKPLPPQITEETYYQPRAPQPSVPQQQVQSQSKAPKRNLQAEREELKAGMEALAESIHEDIEIGGLTELTPANPPKRQDVQFDYLRDTNPDNTDYIREKTQLEYSRQQEMIARRRQEEEHQRMIAESKARSKAEMYRNDIGNRAGANSRAENDFYQGSRANNDMNGSRSFNDYGYGQGLPGNRNAGGNILESQKFDLPIDTRAAQYNFSQAEIGNRARINPSNVDKWMDSRANIDT